MVVAQVCLAESCLLVGMRQSAEARPSLKQRSHCVLRRLRPITASREQSLNWLALQVSVPLGLNRVRSQLKDGKATAPPFREQSRWLLERTAGGRARRTPACLDQRARYHLHC